MDKILKYPKMAVSSFKKLPFLQQLVVAAAIAFALHWVWKNYWLEHFNGESPKSVGTLRCTMYYVDWCPHCNDAKPEWDRIIDLFHGKTLNGKKILVTKIDCVKNADEAKRLGINGYPTFKFDLDGRQMDFSGDRKFDSFKQFIEKITRADHQ